MIKVALLDLDNTLIQNDDISFARAFLEKLEAFGQAHLGKNGLSAGFRAGLKRLQIARPPDETISGAIIFGISNNCDIPAEVVEQGLRTFYTELYPALSIYCTPQQGAEELIHLLKEQGYRIAIATNPIYPLSAVQMRLRAGNLPIHYDFITHADNMHYAKPNPAYYAELIARLGVEPDEAVMIGDRLDNDIQAAQAINIRGFLSGRDGTLQNFAEAMQQRTFEQIPRLPLSPDMIFSQYLGNIGAIFGVIQDIQPRFWHQQPHPDEWSPIQILCHLVDSETSVQRRRLQHILAEDNPFLAQPKPPPKPGEFDCALLEGEAIAHQWASMRTDTMAFLRKLTPEDWKRPARHSIFGPTTFLEMAQFTAQHDRLHIEQLCQTIGKCK